MQVIAQVEQLPEMCASWEGLAFVQTMSQQEGPMEHGEGVLKRESQSFQ